MNEQEKKDVSLLEEENVISENEVIVDVNSSEPIEPTTPKKKKKDKKPAFIFAPIGITLTFLLLGTLGLNLISEITVLILKSANNLQTREEIFHFFTQADVITLINGVRYVIIFAVMLIILFSTNQIKGIFSKFKNKEVWTWAPIYLLVGIGFNFLFGMIRTLIFGEVPDNTNQNIVVNVITANPVSSFFWIVLIGPFVEEFTYRYGLYGTLRRWNKYAALIITALIFGFIHFDFSVIGGSDKQLLYIELLNIPTYIVMGLLFSYAYEKHDIQVPLLAHIFNNLLSYIVAFI